MVGQGDGVRDFDGEQEITGHGVRVDLDGLGIRKLDAAGEQGPEPLVDFDGAVVLGIVG